MSNKYQSRELLIFAFSTSSFQLRYLLAVIFVLFCAEHTESVGGTNQQNKRAPQLGYDVQNFQTPPDNGEGVPYLPLISNPVPVAAVVAQSALPRPQPRIKDGYYTKKGDKPYQLWLDLDGDIHCGAVLIEVLSIQAALTAAHCVWSGGYPTRKSTIDPKRLFVVAGDWILSKKEGTEIGRQALNITIHEDYDGVSQENDIALVFFKGDEFPYNDNIEPVTLPKYNWNELPPRVEISGWGSQNFAGDAQNIMLAAELPTLPHQKCTQFDSGGRLGISEKQFCVASESGTGSCTGDSGGPAVAKNTTGGTNDDILYGVISYGLNQRCGDPKVPSVYVKVSKYVDWINIIGSEYVYMLHNS